MRFPKKGLHVIGAGLAVLIVFATGFFVALGVRSVVAGPDSAPAATPPNPGHTYDQVELPMGTWPGLDADMVDGLEANEIHGTLDCDYWVNCSGPAGMGELTATVSVPSGWTMTGGGCESISQEFSWPRIIKMNGPTDASTWQCRTTDNPWMMSGLGQACAYVVGCKVQ